MPAATLAAYPATAPTLAQRLRLETRDLHVAAERSGVMGALLRGQLPLPSYRALLCNLLAIYVALEVAIEARQADPHMAPLHLPELYRSGALASDLHALGAPLSAAESVVEDAALDYTQRLALMARSQQGGAPELVAHAYVRYLGDLHGGQVLKRVVAQAYALQGGGTRFYEFGNAEQVLMHQQAFRAGLAAVPATAAEADVIVAEARWAFQQHQRLFEQLMARHAG